MICYLLIGGNISQIALISCTKSKNEGACAAKDLYSASYRYNLAYKYAGLIADRIFILSAKYGLLKEDELIGPYDETLNDKSVGERRQWAETVVNQLSQVADLKNDRFILLAGQTYLENIEPQLRYVWRPLKHYQQGLWIPRLRHLIEIEKGTDKAKVLHMLFNDAPRFDWTRVREVPFKNGIYIMFEKGEFFEGLERVTRIGTHRGQNRLKARLRQHLKSGNIESSIFRKNIGRAVSGMIDPNGSDQNIELVISGYLRNNFSFICFPVEEERERLRLEEAIISTFNQHPSFGPSENWLGHNSPVPEISDSGLWNRQGLKKEPVNDLELERIKQLLRFSCFDSKAYLPPKKKTSVQINNYPATITTDNIREHIDTVLRRAETRGLEYIDLISGEIHRTLGLENRMPSVCAAMYKVKSLQDEVLHTTPSGKSSTITIRYYVRNR